MEISEGLKFCIECGQKVEKICPDCGANNPPQSKFCGECGLALTAPAKKSSPKSAPEQRPAPSPPPKELKEKILAQKGRIEGERRQVTVMFCDLEGSTALTEKLGDEKAFALIDEVFGILTKQVHKYEGTVQEFRGDGIMALFGAPIALENAAQRAVNAALAIQQEVTKFSHQIQEENRGPGVQMRIGIHTGPVVLGTIGSDLRLEFQVIGDTVNLAARMESLAEPGTTYVTEETFRQTEGFFRFEKIGEKPVKGKEAPVKVYRVIAPSSLRTRFDVSAERGLTPFLGRQRELELLLGGFERAKTGKGQAFSLIAEAGVGKSRLLYEFRKAVANEEITFLEGRCISYGRGLAYYPVIAILRSNFNIREGEDDIQVREKVQKGLEIIGASESANLPFLLELLSVKDSGLDHLRMSPDSKKEKIIEALKRIILKGSELRPLVIAIEDLHWMDKSSEEALKTILDSIPGSRTFMIFAYRPEYIPPWGGKSFLNQLNLQRLSNRECLEMASFLLGSGEMEKPLEELLLEKAEGIPFFLEEFIKSLKDLKIIESRGNTYGLSKSVSEMTVPTTIQEMILARVDPLPPGAKEVLQAGSVIEREFDFQLIKQVAGLPEPELLSYLSLLKDSELLYERGVYPLSNYIFKHALTREVVYDSILTDRKKMLHEKIGEALEILYKDQLGEYCGLLSEHFIKSGNYQKGSDYSKLAGQRAEKTAAMKDAIGYALKRLSCLEKLPSSLEIEEKVNDLRTIIGVLLIDMNYFKTAQDIITPLIGVDFKGNTKRISRLLTIIGTLELTVKEDLTSAFSHLEEALMLSQESGDMGTLGMVSYWIGCAQSFNCEFEKARTNLERSEEIQRKAKIPWREATLKSLLGYFVYFYPGNMDLAFKTSSEAVKISEESGDIYSKTFAYSCHGISCFGRGIFQEALDFLIQGRDFSEKLDQYWWQPWSNQFLGEVYYEMQRYPEAMGSYSKAVSLFELYGNWPSSAIVSKIGLERARTKGQREQINLESLYNTVSEAKQKVYEGWIYRYVSEILLNILGDRLIDAEQWVQKAIKADQRNSTTWSLARDYLSYADLLTKKGDRLQARENLGKAIETFKECGADGWVEKAERKLARVS